MIARAVREQGILTVGVVTKPFHFEGAHRMRVAEGGLAELQQYVDTLIVIPNQNLFRIANERTTFAEAFKLADNVLHMGVRGVTDLMVMPGLINLDFADIRTVMSEMGKAMMGTGEGSGERRAIEAAEAAISNPLLDEVSMRGARGVLINITGGADMTLFEVDEAANRIKEEVDPDANIIVGSTLDESLDGVMRVSVVATGIEAAERGGRRHGRGAREQAVRAQHAQFPAAAAARQAGCRGGRPAQGRFGGDRRRGAGAQGSRAAPGSDRAGESSGGPGQRRRGGHQAQGTRRRAGLLASAIAPAGALPGMGQAARPVRGAERPPSLFERVTATFRKEREVVPGPPAVAAKAATRPWRPRGGSVRHPAACAASARSGTSSTSGCNKL